MQLRHFICGSSVILIGWLAITFVYQVPSQRYPKLDRYPTTTVETPAPEAAPDTHMTTSVTEDSEAQVISLSH